MVIYIHHTYVYVCEITLGRLSPNRFLPSDLQLARREKIRLFRKRRLGDDHTFIIKSQVFAGVFSRYAIVQKAPAHAAINYNADSLGGARPVQVIYYPGEETGYWKMGWWKMGSEGVGKSSRRRSEYLRRYVNVFAPLNNVRRFLDCPERLSIFFF